MLDYNIGVSKFEIQSRYYIHFQMNTLGKDMNIFISPPTLAIGQIVPLLFFKDGFGIEYHAKVDMPLDQRNQTKHCS